MRGEFQKPAFPQQITEAAKRFEVEQKRLASTPTSATVEEIARETAEDCILLSHQSDPNFGRFRARILTGITAALAPLQAEIDDARIRAGCGPNCTLASAIEGNKMALQQMGTDLTEAKKINTAAHDQLATAYEQLEQARRDRDEAIELNLGLVNENLSLKKRLATAYGEAQA